MFRTAQDAVTGQRPGMQVQQLSGERTTPETILPNENSIAREPKQGNRSNMQKSTVPVFFKNCWYSQNVGLQPARSATQSILVMSNT